MCYLLILARECYYFQAGGEVLFWYYFREVLFCVVEVYQSLCRWDFPRLEMVGTGKGFCFVVDLIFTRTKLLENPRIIF